MRLELTMARATSCLLNGAVIDVNEALTSICNAWAVSRFPV
jgi:hypothetical protein